MLLSSAKRTAEPFYSVRGAGEGTYSFMNAMETIGTVEVVLRQALLLQSVLWANCNNGLGRSQSLKTLGLPRSFAPGIFLFEHMKQCYNVAQTAAK